MGQDQELSERENLILQAAVHSFITTAEPVGSRAIVKRFGLDVSAATVRNVMADLEEAGYLQQLHTSSGRVPTDAGYRYYVDYLMRAQELTLQERARIEQELTSRINDADEIMHQTSHLLALISQQTGIVETPDEGTAQVNRIDVIPVTPSRLAVLIADSVGRVRTHMVSVEPPIEATMLPRVSAFLNENFRGVPVDKLLASVQTRLRMFMDEQRRVAEDALRVVQLLPANRPGTLYLEGATQLFEQPEFRDVDRAREVFVLFEEKDRLLEILRSKVLQGESRRTMVMIGKEVPGEGVDGISLVASPYSVGTTRVGMIGVLGPRRMPYSKVTALVDYTATLLSRLLTRLAT
ncbi:MAG TPA: heat-inducible transcriptional repressor HrcA [Candidatus Hydrogenedentes bacterium]|nr:heat-inducible transcriptional repressor HrcA [Candidatus Hydrogenedentota bacterium]HRK35624.1 heat-inducible transcriptional repressor HrcA [Candidatus Hydrogenedentota bacterium]